MEFTTGAKKLSLTKKIGLILFGIIMSILILELALQITSVALHKIQRISLPWEDAHPDAIRILTVGESTTAKLYNGNVSWPIFLERYLNNNSDKHFIVHNDAIVGTNTLLILSDIERDIQKYKPDVVVTMMGINDGFVNIGTPTIAPADEESIFSVSKVYNLSIWLKDSLLPSNESEIEKEIKSLINSQQLPLPIFRKTLDEAIEN